MSHDTVTMRVAKEVQARLERYARFLGKKPTETGTMLLEEGLRRLEHPGIDFHQSGIGRQAYLQGTKLTVWSVYLKAREQNYDPVKTAEALQLMEPQVQAAMRYTQQYKEEIKTAIDDYEAVNAQLLNGAMPGLEVLNVTAD